MAKNNQAALTIQEEFANKIKTENQREKMIKWAPVLVLVALIAFFTIARGSAFASVNNLITILNQWAIPLLVALGLTFVIMLGSIDLSIDGTVGMAGSIAAVLLMNNMNSNDFGIFGIIIAILCSVLVGFLIGVIHVKLKVPSFMVSFAFMNICTGIAYVAYSGTPAKVTDPVFAALPKVSFLGIPLITWIALVMLAICIYIQEYTPFGRHIYAVGTDETIPRSVGINVDMVKIKVFTLAGFLFGVAGVVGLIREQLGQASIGTGRMFPAQAAVVIGGTSLAGGKGGVINTIVGTLIMTVLENGLNMMGVDSNIKTGIQGIIILVAVILTTKRGSTIISK